MRKIIFIAAVFLSGCAVTATGPDFTPAPKPAQNEGLIYFMRSPLVGGEENVVAFIVDGQDVVELNSQGYSWLHLPEGRHQIKTEHRSLMQSSGGKMNIIVDVRSGEQYYVERLDDSREGNRYVSRLLVAKPQDAETRIKSYKYKPAVAIPKNLEQRPATDPQKATVYLYRSLPAAAHVNPDIIWSMDNKTVCSMEDRRYTVLNIEKGEHELKVEWDPYKRPFFADAYKDKTYKLAVEAGKTYYINYQISGKDGNLWSTNLTQEDEGQAKLNLSLATYQNNCKN